MTSKLSDIKTRADIEKLVDLFYQELQKDNILNEFFKNTDWNKHLSVMYNFWESVLFLSDNYTGNPMEQHKFHHLRMAMTKQHFDRWIRLFNKTTDTLFSGENADLIKTRARNIAMVMQKKIAPNRESE